MIGAKEDPPKNKALNKWILYIAVGTALIIGSFVYSVQTSWNQLLSDRTLGNFISMVSEMIPPDLSIIPTLGKPVLETMAMSVMSTLIAALIAVPLGFLAAKNTTPNLMVRGTVRAVFNILRAVPDLIIGIICVAAVGFGILPGIMALGFSSVGMLGKFYSEAIEKVDGNISEAIEATGASKFQVIFFSVIPQVIPHFIDYTLYRWEYNFRASSIVGLIGAGGIGFQLIASLRIMQYKEVSAMILLVYVLVQLVDGFGNLVRKKIVEGDKK